MQGPSVTRRNFRQYDRDHGQAGMHCLSAPAAGLSTLALVANRAYFTRFQPSRNILVVSVNFEVTTFASADDACDVGLYSSALVRLGSAGATAGKLTTNGNKSVTLTSPTLLVAGLVYYASLSSGAQGGTAASVRSYSLTLAAVAESFGAAAPQVETGYQNTAHVLPDPAVFVSAINNTARLWVKES